MGSTTNFTSLSLSGTLEVTGLITATGGISGAMAGALTGTTGTFSSTLDVTGAQTNVSTLAVGNTTTGFVTAGGGSMIYGLGKHKTNALTGTLRGVRGNAYVTIASANGTCVGVEGRAGTGSSTTGTDGVNLGTAIGVYGLIGGVGQSGPVVLSNAIGVKAELDINAQNLTVADARGLYVLVQSGNDTANTLTACNLAYLQYESVVGTAPAINAAIKIATVGGATGATMLIDATTFNLAATDTDKVTLLKFRAGDGTVTYMRYDKSDNALAFATS